MARSMTNQIFQVQKETIPGTPLTAAMKRLMGITARPAVANSGGESFKASGYKANTAHMIGDLTASGPSRVSRISTPSATSRRPSTGRR